MDEPRLQALGMLDKRKAEWVPLASKASEKDQRRWASLENSVTVGKKTSVTEV